MDYHCAAYKLLADSVAMVLHAAETNTCTLNQCQKQATFYWLYVFIQPTPPQEDTFRPRQQAATVSSRSEPRRHYYADALARASLRSADLRKKASTTAAARRADSQAAVSSSNV